MFGCVGWALCASIVGIMFTITNQFVFWLGSGCAFILAFTLFAKTDAPSSTPMRATIRHLALSWRWNCSDSNLWFLSLYVIGVSCTYDVFDQQFANFFTSLFATGEQGTRVFGYVMTMGELLNALILPPIINRIGGKTLFAVALLCQYVIGSSSTSALKWLFENAAYV
ncbi:MFS transporter [Klebsiella pneumoniae]